MSEQSIGDLQSRKRQGSFLDGLARKVVLRFLGQLQDCELAVEENGEHFVFGDTSSELKAQIVIHQPWAYRSLLSDGSIGAGESYIDGAWSSPDLVALIRVFARNIDLLNKLDRRWPLLSSLLNRIAHRGRANSLSGSRQNIAAHYDLSNKFFELFLDPQMMYSAAIYRTDSTSLEEAAVTKLERVCQQLQLNPSDHLLEIGSGWGGMAIHAAQNYGCRVTTTTLSREQFEWVQARVDALGLKDQITVLLDDYRELQGSYDKLVSIEMIEAVGHQFYDQYFRMCSQLLKPEGLMMLQAITIADQRFDDAKRSVDFIQKYIFPGGSLPSVAVMADCVSRCTDMMMVDLRDMGRDYALTLKDWRQRFMARQNDVEALGFRADFRRMWEFYLAYCEGGFQERAISTVQVLMAKPRAELARGFRPV